MNLLRHGNLISKRTKNHIIDIKRQKNIYRGRKLIFWDSGLSYFQGKLRVES